MRAHALPAPATLPPSVNYHLLIPCNMRCLGCFATFHDVRAGLPKGLLPRAESLALVRALARRFEKVTFAGGEPTLCPWLDEMLAVARAEGATTMLVTNGSRLTREWLARAALDWLTLSIDSPDPATHVALGRAVNGRALPVERYVAVADAARALGIGVKVNTVVSARNADEDFSALIARLRPERWKVLQMLPVDGQNDGRVEPLLIERARFDAFVARHRPVGTVMVPEDNEAMTGSYAMVDPQGRFFDNTEGRYRYSAPILAAGIDAAWREVRFEAGRFAARGGQYDWARTTEGA